MLGVVFPSSLLLLLTNKLKLKLLFVIRGWNIVTTRFSF